MSCLKTSWVQHSDWSSGANCLGYFKHDMLSSSVAVTTMLPCTATNACIVESTCDAFCLSVLVTCYTWFSNCTTPLSFNGGQDKNCHYRDHTTVATAWIDSSACAVLQGYFWKVAHWCHWSTSSRLCLYPSMSQIPHPVFIFQVSVLAIIFFHTCPYLISLCWQHPYSNPWSVQIAAVTALNSSCQSIMDWKALYVSLSRDCGSCPVCYTYWLRCSGHVKV